MSRTSNALNALVSSEQVHFKQTSERVGTDGRVPDEIWERVQTLGPATEKGPTAVSVEPVVRYCRQLTVGGTQLLLSVDTGGQNAVVRQVRRCAAVQTPVNCHCQLEKHPVGDVEPVKFVMQYLTQATVKLPSAGDDTRSSVQHML